MTDKQIAWAAAIVLAPLALWITYRSLFWLWRVLPDGKVKRLLFRSYWGADPGPWANQPWQRKEARERSVIARRDREGL